MLVFNRRLHKYSKKHKESVITKPFNEVQHKNFLAQIIVNRTFKTQLTNENMT